MNQSEDKLIRVMRDPIESLDVISDFICITEYNRGLFLAITLG